MHNGSQGKWVGKACLGLAVLFMAVVMASMAVGERLLHPVLWAVGPAPADLHVQSITIQTAHGESVAAWRTAGQPGAGVVLLLHGVQLSRVHMLPRIRMLQRLGYGVLAVDLPGHGESKSAHITYGFNEARAVNAVLAYLRTTLPEEKIGVIGVSLGAAAVVLAQPDPVPDALVLESMFPTIQEAVVDRLKGHFGAAGEWLAPLILWQLPLRLGLSPEQLRPIVALPNMHTPVLIAAGADDKRTTLAETQRIFAAANAPKALWVVEGAGHVDLHDFDAATYEAKIPTFLALYLRPLQPLQPLAAPDLHRAP
jgi:uncharacterized protein